MRLFVNFFQPSFKLAAKARDGAKVTKRYHPPATPCERLMADARTSGEVRRRLEVLRATLDPVRLLQQIRVAQHELVHLADASVIGDVAPPTAPALEQFLSGLPTAWREREVRPTRAPHWTTDENKDWPGESGQPIDPANPPLFESQATFLDRHGLLLPGERKRLTDADFAPETVELADRELVDDAGDEERLA